MRLKLLVAGLAWILAMPVMAADEFSPGLLADLVQATFPGASIRSIPESRCEPRPAEAVRGGVTRALPPCF